MKAIKSIFSDVLYTKVEYVKNDPLGEFHVYKRDGAFGMWRHSYQYNTLAEAEEFANSRGESVVYMGVYEKGVRKGMTDWEDKKEQKQIPAPLPYVLPPSDEVEFERKFLRKEPRK